MPVIFVYGISKKAREKSNLSDLKRSIKQHIAAIKELGLAEQDITVFFPTDCLENEVGEDVIVFVKGLFDKPERTQEVRQRLAQNTADCCEDFLRPYAEPDLLVECFLDPPFDPKSGFGSVAVHALTENDISPVEVLPYPTPDGDHL